jgi:hypothetical protein
MKTTALLAPEEGEAFADGIGHSHAVDARQYGDRFNTVQI